jgi:signal peptidase I
MRKAPKGAFYMQALITIPHILRYIQYQINKTPQKLEHFMPTINCALLTLKVVGTSMLPMIQPADRLAVEPTECLKSEIQKEDVILFRSGIDKNPLVKTVHATEGDTLKVDIQGNTGTIFVNNEEITNSAGEKFKLSTNRSKMIKLYEGTLNPNTFLVMGERALGTNDSSRIGLIHKDDVIGRVIEINRPQ